MPHGIRQGAAALLDAGIPATVAVRTYGPTPTRGSWARYQDVATQLQRELFRLTSIF